MKDFTAFLLFPLNPAEREIHIRHWESASCSMPNACLYVGLGIGVLSWVAMAFIILIVLSLVVGG